jgi:phenylpyruvate tautomerase PptA (4-oxalocrotonate tautomerase family)/limonene-1,2-epoxide hydrolase
MPVIEAHLLEGYDPDAKRRLGEALTDAVRLVVPASPDAITVLIHEMAASDYMRGRAPRRPADALPDPVEIVRDYLSAMQARQIDRAKALLGAGFVMTFPGTAPMTRIEDLLAWAAPRYRHVTKTYDGFDCAVSADGHAVIFCRGTLAGEWPDGTAFAGIRFIDRFEVEKGLIVRQDVWNDIAEVLAQT